MHPFIASRLEGCSAGEQRLCSVHLQRGVPCTRSCCQQRSGDACPAAAQKLGKAVAQLPQGSPHLKFNCGWFSWTWMTKK